MAVAPLPLYHGRTRVVWRIVCRATLDGKIRSDCCSYLYFNALYISATNGMLYVCAVVWRNVPLFISLAYDACVRVPLFGSMAEPSFGSMT